MPPGSPKEQRNPPDKMSQEKKEKNKIDKLDIAIFFLYNFIQEYADQIEGEKTFQKLAKDLCESFNVSELMQGSQ